MEKMLNFLNAYFNSFILAHKAKNVAIKNKGVISSIKNYVKNSVENVQLQAA